MNQANPATDRTKLLTSARKALIKSLNDFGTDATLDMVVRLSVNDLVANELLCFYPKIVSMGEFLARIPVFPKIEMKRLGNRRGNGQKR